MTLGEKLRHLREGKYSQEELAEKLNVHNNTISKWENDIQAPRISKLIDIARIFDVPKGYLLDDNDTVNGDISASQTFNKSSSYQDTTEIKGTESSVAYWGTVVDNAKKVSPNNPDLLLIIQMIESAGLALRSKLSGTEMAQLVR